MNTATPLETLSTRIQALEPRLRSIANKFAADPMDADDIFSEIVEAILTKCEPEFSDAMIITKAKWVAYDHVNSTRIYTKYIGDASSVSTQADDEDVETYDVDFTQTTYANPEQALIDAEDAQALAHAVSQLSPTMQMIVSLLRKGYRPVDIANKMGVSKSAVTQNMQKISRTMVALSIR